MVEETKAMLKKWCGVFALIVLIILAGLTPFSCSLYGAAIMPMLNAENTQGSLTGRIVVTARFKRVLNFGAFRKQRLQTYLRARDERWSQLEAIESDDKGQARLSLAAGTFSQPGKYFIGWKTIDEDAADQTIKVSIVTVTR